MGVEGRFGLRWMIAGVVAAFVAGCGAQAAPSAPPATPSPTPAPTATPLPGSALPAGWRPEGRWSVTFSRPGDIIREAWDITPTCPEGACDALVRMTDVSGAELGTGAFVLTDGRYVLTSTTSGAVDCDAGGRTRVEGGTARVETTLVLGLYRPAGTAKEQPGIQGTRTVALEPRGGSGCAPSTTVYPALGAPAR